MQIRAREPGVPGNWLGNRVRPKLPAIEVSGRHSIPVILRASTRGRQARMGGQVVASLTQQQGSETIVHVTARPGAFHRHVY